MSPTNPPTPPPQTHPTGERRAELERIKAAVWPPDEPPEVRQERIRRNLEALDSLPKWEFPVELDAETWKWIAESPDVYDED
jgi:hypothetical protein